MRQNKHNPVAVILALFILCSFFEYIEFLWIRTDQTIIADNIINKLICILLIYIVLKLQKKSFRDIGFRLKGMGKGILYGFALGIITFTIAYAVEIICLKAMGHSVTLSFYATNFSLTGVPIKTVSFTAIALCVAANIINVWAEEGLFRGLFLKMAQRKYSFRISNWIQAGLFGLWHIVMVVLSVYDGLMDAGTAIVMAIGYVILAMILGLQWGICVSITGTLWVGISAHFFNNFIGNMLHVITETGVDELQILRIVLSNILSLCIILLVQRRLKRQKEKNRQTPTL